MSSVAPTQPESGRKASWRLTWAKAVAAACVLTGPACRTADSSDRRPNIEPLLAPPAKTADSEAFRKLPASMAGSARVSFGDGVAEFHLPEGESATRLPLLVLLHGLGSSGQQTIEQLDLTAFAQQKRFIYVAPDGTLDPAGRRFWNAGAVCCNFFNARVDDVSRLTELVEHAVTRLGADSRRVYAVGYSNGGFMAHRWACERSKQLAAIVSIAGSGPSTEDRCVPELPVAVLEVHGDRDPIVPMAGGHLFGRPELPKIGQLRQSLNTWVRHNGCEPELRRTGKLDLVSDLAGAESERGVFPACRKSPVELWTVVGGNHYLALKSTAVEQIWDFLVRQSKSEG